MSSKQIQPAKVYQNVMEGLVAEEVEHQLKRIDSSLLRYIDPIEVATYALNRLPPLYVSSQEGQERQLKHGRQKLGDQIITAVRQAIAAVQRDPLRTSTPLSWASTRELESAQKALEALRLILNRPDLSWETLVPAVRQCLYLASHKHRDPRGER